MESKHIEKLSEKDLTELTILYLCKNKKSRRFIDDLYNQHYDECIEVSNDARLKFKNIIKERECIETKCYINKISALMVLDEQNGTRDNIMHILKNVYRKAYNYVVSVDKVKPDNFWSKHLKGKTYSTSNLCSEMAALLYITSSLKKEVDYTDRAYKIACLTFPGINTAKAEEQSKPGYFYNQANREVKDLVDKIETNLRLTRFKKYSYEQMLLGLENNEHIEGTTYQKYSIMNVLSLTSGSTNVGSILNNIELSREAVKDIITMYIVACAEDAETFESMSSINTDEAACFLYTYMIQAMFIKLYERTEEFFFENYDEDAVTRQKELVRENREIKKKNLLLTDKNDQLQREIEDLKRQLNKANKELEKSSSNNKELFELRNYMFNNQEEHEEYVTHQEYNTDYLEDKKVVCFGGSNSWVSNMSNEFNWSFIPADNINFDTSILKGVDIIVIKATYISHGMYYKIMSNAPKDASIKFINGTNINKIKYELSNYNN